MRSAAPKSWSMMIRAYAAFVPATATAFAKAKQNEVAGLVFDGRQRVGKRRAVAIRRAAKKTVGAHQTEVWAMQVRMYVEDLVLFDRREAREPIDVRTSVLVSVVILVGCWLVLRIFFGIAAYFFGYAFRIFGMNNVFKEYL